MDGVTKEASVSGVLVHELVGFEVSIKVLEGDAGEREEAQVGHFLRHAREALAHDPLEDGRAARARCHCRCCRAELSVEQALAHGQRERVGLVGQHALAGRIDEHLVVGVLEQLSEPHECHLVQARPGHARQQCRRAGRVRRRRESAEESSRGAHGGQLELFVVVVAFAGSGDVVDCA